MAESWHSEFNPKQFLSRVDIDSFIERNEAYRENRIAKSQNPCILCGKTKGPGLLLNDKSYLCRNCFADVSTITYPEIDERRRRDHIRDVEARRYAEEAFAHNCLFRKLSSLTSVIGWASLLLLFHTISLIVVPIALYMIWCALHSKHEKKIAEWESAFPPLEEPQFRHFHDPDARLTSRDHSILKVFNNWPGYPPFWGYLRKVVMLRDQNRCQVSGCPSRVELHIHHKVPVSQGGKHIPANLVTLCAFHHALEPTEGHERIWGEIKTRYFTLVRSHKRRNPSTPGYHNVTAHVRRLELVKESDLSAVMDFYELSCPFCGSFDLMMSIDIRKGRISIKCLGCQKTWNGARRLCEETGPRLAEALQVKKNRGSWSPRWDMLEARSDSVFYVLKKTMSEPMAKKRTISSKHSTNPKCPLCGSAMRFIEPKDGQRWKEFWGCNRFRTTGCKGSRRA